MPSLEVLEDEVQMDAQNVICPLQLEQPLLGPVVGSWSEKFDWPLEMSATVTSNPEKLGHVRTHGTN
ncbi:MAG: hypothetical protein ACE5OZ_26545, partial [Candidatus Heimdallarchaeota archaeon]